MVKLNIDMPISCQDCPFKGARLCYINTWLRMKHREVPEDGKPEWCMLEDMSQYEDNRK